MRQRLQIGVWVAGAAFTVAWGQWLPRLFNERMPQVAGENIVAMVLGDARQALSFALLEKADDYFHGGVQHVACEQGLAEPSDEDEKEGEHDHAAHVDEHEESHAHAHDHGGTLHDPWSWLNAQVHAQAHRHMADKDARELLPWLWAACRASPQNSQAYESAAYVLERMLKRPQDAAKLLEEAIRNNPDNASLDISLGELAIRSLKDEAKAERAFKAAREKLRPAEGPTGDDDRFMQARTLFYLGYLALQRHDVACAKTYLAEAEAQVPNLVGTQNLRDILLRYEKEAKKP